MSENTAPARCTETEWTAARAAGLLVVTSAEEVALHKFAERIRSEVLANLLPTFEELVDLMQDVIDGNYKPDSFTLQPARAALAKARPTPGEGA